MANNEHLNEVRDYLSSLELEFYTLDYFNILIKELEMFAKINDLDVHINITDETNHNTRLVIDINE